MEAGRSAHAMDFLKSRPGDCTELHRQLEDGLDSIRAKEGEMSIDLTALWGLG